ncbi:hypothetical protein SAMN05216266_111108 [Amycolatopsis marina]|uniref:PPE family protein n=2 Tax=Amycolatopsis marina TaxID=490629 RepID=A0A1I1B4A7_9PSEU|nr:hypothetical protein SAMN05216266_111108 [Amycolatopsis marina]
MSGVWEAYFGHQAPPECGVNWDAYSHEELYQMLWQDADIADVSAIAGEWSEHRAALVNHAEVLREQRAALLESWQGTGAEQAARRLAELADRVEKIAELAHAGEQAAEQAAEALARARATMPAPPGDPAAPMTGAAANWADVMGTPLATAPDRTDRRVEANTSAPDAGSAFSAVGGAGFSFYNGANAMDMQKQQAVRSMQSYESSLTTSSQLIGQAQSTIPAATTTPSSAAGAGGTAGSGAGAKQSVQALPGAGGRSSTNTPIAAGAGAFAGVAGGSAVGTLGGGAPTTTGKGSAGNPLAQGRAVGAIGMQGGPAAMAARMAAESATIRTGAMGGMVPPGPGARGGTDEDVHENQLPTIDHGLFPLEEPGSEAVIGLSEGDE